MKLHERLAVIFLLKKANMGCVVFFFLFLQESLCKSISVA